MLKLDLTDWYLSSNMGRQQDKGILWLKKARNIPAIICQFRVRNLPKPNDNKTDDLNPDGVGAG